MEADFSAIGPNGVLKPHGSTFLRSRRTNSLGFALVCAAPITQIQNNGGFSPWVLPESTVNEPVWAGMHTTLNRLML